MHVLSFDTAADFCCVVLMVNGQVADQRLVMTQRDQAKILAPLTLGLLNAHNLTAQQIDRFAIATGPGSFTGLRVGLAFARGLGLATDKPVLGFDHFVCMSRAINKENPVLLVRDSKRADLFACWLEDGKLDVPFLATPEQLAGKIITKKDALFCKDELLNFSSPADSFSLPFETCAVNAAHFASKTADNEAHPPQPLYLREADVTKPRALA